MIIDKYQYDCYLLKKNIKMQNTINVLAFNKEEEETICKAVMNYNNNFIIINTDEILNVFDVHNLYFCNKDNVESIMQSIYRETNHEEKKEPNHVNNIMRNTEYIVLMKEEMNSKSYHDFYKKNFDYTYMKKKLVGFQPYQVCVYHNHIVIKYTDQSILLDSLDISENVIHKYLVPFEGVGDTFMQFSIIRKFIEQETSNKNKVSMICIGNNTTIKFLSELLDQSIEILYISTGAQYLDWCKLISEDSNISLFNRFFDGCKAGGKYSTGDYHITDIMKEMLGIQKEFGVYDYLEILHHRILELIPRQEKEYVDDFYDGKKYVGFQYFTGSYDSANDVWYSMSKKNWSESHVREFVELCNANNISLLTFSDGPYHEIKTEKLKPMSIYGYAYAISKLEAVVGIDSSAGHIAATYYIPSITLWGGQLPLYSWGANVSFRPLTMNLSIYSKDLDINKISPGYVSKMLHKVMHHEIDLESKIIGYHDQVNIKSLG